MGGVIARDVAEPADVASPCNQICTLDVDDQCVGCGRTLDEIAAWSTMTVAEKRAVLAALPMRRLCP